MTVSIGYFFIVAPQRHNRVCLRTKDNEQRTSPKEEIVGMKNTLSSSENDEKHIQDKMTYMSTSWRNPIFSSCKAKRRRLKMALDKETWLSDAVKRFYSV